MLKKWFGLILLDQVLIGVVLALSKLYGGPTALIVGSLLGRCACLSLAIYMFWWNPSWELRFRVPPLSRVLIYSILLALVGISSFLANLFFSKHLQSPLNGAGQFADQLVLLTARMQVSHWNTNALGYLVLISSVIIGPIFEEIMFRGLLHAILRKWFESGVSVLIVAVVFAAFHEKIPLAAFVISIAFSAVAIRTRSLISGCIGHGATNIVAVTIGLGIG